MISAGSNPATAMTKGMVRTTVASAELWGPVPVRELSRAIQGITDTTFSSAASHQLTAGFRHQWNIEDVMVPGEGRGF